MLEDEREQLNKLAREAFILNTDIAEARKQFEERFDKLQKSGRKLYEKLDRKET